MKKRKETAQATINALSNELPVNAISSDIAQPQGGKIDKVTEKLSGIRNELQQKDVQLNPVKSTTDALLKGQ